MTKEEAIKKLKEAKELRDLEVISSEEYNSLLEKYKPLLLDEESFDNTIPSNHLTYVPKDHKSVADNNLAERQKGDSTPSEGNTAARSKQNNTTNKNSNQNTTGTILWLIFFSPVGLYKMWNRRYWTKSTRWIITVVCILVYSAFSESGGLSKKDKLNIQSEYTTPKTNNIPAGVSTACYCQDALSGGNIYNSSSDYIKCKRMYICFENAQADCMFGTSRVWTTCIGR